MKNLIFDFDGVLANTYKAATLAHQRINGDIVDSEAFTSLDTYSIKKPNHAKNHLLSPEQLVKLNARVKEFGILVEHFGFEMFSDFIDEIKLIKDSRKAVVSSGARSYVGPALERTGINFSHVLTFEDHHSKEDKVGSVCSDWGVSIEDVYYFTDTLADVYELKDIIHKDKLIGVSWGYCTKDQLLTELPIENILNSPVDLHKVIA